MKKTLIFLLFTFLTVSCGFQNVQNVREAKLMPNDVATHIIRKHFGDSWFVNPVGNLPGPGMQALCGGKQFPMPINSITEFQSSSKNQITVIKDRKAFTCGFLMYTVKRDTPYTQEELDDIMDALVSLGSKIQQKH
jgi:hypothetical protein